MSSNGQDHQVHNGQDLAEDPQEEDDDDFGDFEGFEGGIERMQAQPAPSPWATFPDLLPVQTSPATPAEDAQGSSSRNAPPREAWPAVASVSSRNGAGPSHENGSRSMPQQIRTHNPPDVSLGTNQAVGGRITPDNVHDAALAVVMDHLDNGLDARLPVAQIDRLSQQLETEEQNRFLLEGQLNGLRQRNQELELQLQQQVVNSQEQINDLTARLQQNQEILEQRLIEIGELNTNAWRQDMKQIQEEILALRHSQVQAGSNIQASHQTADELKTEIFDRIHALESNLQKAFSEMEKRLFGMFEERCKQTQDIVETVLQKNLQQVTSSISQAVNDAIQNSSSASNEQGNLLHCIKEELQKHKDYQKKTLDSERLRQLSIFSSALQSALQQLNNSMEQEQKDKKGNVS